MGMNGEWMSMNGRWWTDETEQMNNNGRRMERGRTSNGTMTNVERNNDEHQT
jgi:hypothetical protein